MPLASTWELSGSTRMILVSGRFSGSDVLVALSYKNWAALDGIGSRIDSVTLGHYGSAAKRTAAGNSRNEHRTVVKSFLVREQTIIPWK